MLKSNVLGVSCFTVSFGSQEALKHDTPQLRVLFFFPFFFKALTGFPDLNPCLFFFFSPSLLAGEPRRTCASPRGSHLPSPLCVLPSAGASQRGGFGNLLHHSCPPHPHPLFPPESLIFTLCSHWPFLEARGGAPLPCFREPPQAPVIPPGDHSVLRSAVGLRTPALGAFRVGPFSAPKYLGSSRHPSRTNVQKNCLVINTDSWVFRQRF